MPPSPVIPAPVDDARLAAAIARVNEKRRELAEASEELRRVVDEVCQIVPTVPVGGATRKATILVTPRKRHLVNAYGATACKRRMTGDEVLKEIDVAYQAEAVTCPVCRVAANLPALDGASEAAQWVRPTRTV
jgi:hypothetical protein